MGLVALPLALGFGVSSGMGAVAGLATAIVAHALAAIFGGSGVQVSGPTGAMTVVLVPIIALHGPDGVLVVGVMAGLILIGPGYARAGRVIRYVPISVVEGFTVGIAVIIALQQIPAALGVDAHAEKVLALAALATRSRVADPVLIPPTIIASWPSWASTTDWPTNATSSRASPAPSSMPGCTSSEWKRGSLAPWQPTKPTSSSSAPSRWLAPCGPPHGPRLAGHRAGGRR